MGEFREASAKRKLLAFYLDYLIYGCALEIVWFAYFDQELGFVLKMMLVIALELVLLNWLGSPGERFLSIGPEPDRPERRGYNPFMRKLVVPDEVLQTERWYTILLGVLMVNSGAKEAVRWTMFAPPAPLFGFIPSVEIFGTLSILFGALLIYNGYLVLSLRKTALLLGLACLLFEISSFLTSWNQWDDYATKYITQKYEYQGRAVRPGEIELAQMLVPELALVMYFFMAGWLIAVKNRLRIGSYKPRELSQ